MDAYETAKQFREQFTPEQMKAAQIAVLGVKVYNQVQEARIQALRDEEQRAETGDKDRTEVNG